MALNVVTIALTDGARGEQIGPLVAKQLGFQFVNDEILDRAAQQAGVSREDIAEVERSPSLMSQILSAVFVGGTGEFPIYAGPGQTADPSTSYRELIQDVIRETAAKGQVVILAHGAGMLLGGTPGVLRVLVTASPFIRAQRLMAERGLDERKATREIERTDGERQKFFKRFYDLDEEPATAYDLVVNTDALSAEAAARVIGFAAQNG